MRAQLWQCICCLRAHTHPAAACLLANTQTHLHTTESDSALRSIQALHGTKIGDKLLHVSLQAPRLRAAAIHTMQ
jgi:hypothetical protein